MRKKLLSGKRESRELGIILKMCNFPQTEHGSRAYCSEASEDYLYQQIHLLLYYDSLMTLRSRCYLSLNLISTTILLPSDPQHDLNITLDPPQTKGVMKSINKHKIPASF